ncbi:hypothetical protein JCM19233_2008 [Vibrio astriarenae]|nr:hypothetical protein JCM19233_2008 [Vibrio sp. C7]
MARPIKKVVLLIENLGVLFITMFLITDVLFGYSTHSEERASFYLADFYDYFVKFSI